MLFATTSATTNSGAFSSVTDFFSSSYFSALVKLAALFGLALYGATVFWTWKDARRRIEDPVIVGVCVATAVCFPFVGVLIYLILRPPEYIADVHERELEIRAMERRLGADSVCPYCRNPSEASFLSCPHCGTKLKQACRRCKAPARPDLAPVPVLRDGGDDAAAAGTPAPPRRPAHDHRGLSGPPRPSWPTSSAPCFWSSPMPWSGGWWARSCRASSAAASRSAA